jgi:hypothetical protein
MKISTILDKIDERQLFVPAFQREYVWKREDAKQLIDSLIKEYPTGTMLTWETSNPPELKGPYKYDEKQGAVRILLDGQQRVTTLYMLIRGEIPSYYTPAEIEHDTRDLYVNLESLELSYYMRMRMANDPYWQNITDVFQGKVDAFDLKSKFDELGKTLTMDELKILNENINAVTRIKDKDFPEQTIPVKASIRESIDIFYKVNASGVALTDAELALAQISGYWPEARDLFKAKLASLEEAGFNFKLDFLIYVLLGCLYHLGSDMRKLHDEENKERLQEVWRQLDTQTLDYVVNLLREHAYVDHSHEINSVYALVPMIVYCVDQDGKHLTDEEIRKMVKWFYYSQIKARYVSQLPQKLDRDLRMLVESTQPFDDLLQVIAEENRLEVMPADMEGSAVQHPLFAMTRWYLRSRGAVCLTTGMSLRKNMGKKYQLEFDHIFPYSKLKELGYGKGNRVKYALAQEFTNRAMLTQVANRTKSAMDAADYLSAVEERFPTALELQCIPTKRELWQIDHYEQFLAERRAMLAEHLNTYLKKITETSTTTIPVSIQDLIADGESDELEFKATLRWDLRAGGVNKKLEEAVLKTVAAFANADGGTLLIGVSDDGEVIGLEHDYVSLDGGNGDKLQLHLRNLLTEQFGASHVAQTVDVAILDVDGKDICQIEVARSNKPLVLRTKDKNGQTIESFYIRNGNLSQAIPMSEFHAYAQTRFRE